MKVGTVCYATEQGLGRLAKDFYDHGVITDLVILAHGRNALHPERYPPDTPVLTSRRFVGHPAVEAMLCRVEAMLFFETPFDWEMLGECRRRGIRTAVMPMHEWTLITCPAQPDRWLCPSKLDQQYFKGSPFVQVPVDPATWRPRTRAVRFLHNAGHVGCRGHKGTLELLKAMKHVESPLELTVRCQHGERLSALVREAGVEHDGRIKLVCGEVHYDWLFTEHDVYVAPEKFNGLSLPLQEARAAGMLVVTTDRFPANDWLPPDGMIPVAGTSRQRVSSGYNWFDEAQVDPVDIARVLDRVYASDIAGYSHSGRRWAERNSWAVLKDRWLEALS